jgi:hypothetical protein
VATWSPTFGAAIAVGAPALKADQLLHAGAWVELSTREYKDQGDAQVLWTMQGTYLFARAEEQGLYAVLPPGATQAWDEESRRLATWLWPVMGTPTVDGPLEFDLKGNPLDAVPTASIECSDSVCSGYSTGFDLTPRQAGDDIVDLAQLVQLP